MIKKIDFWLKNNHSYHMRKTPLLVVLMLLPLALYAQLPVQTNLLTGYVGNYGVAPQANIACTLTLVDPNPRTFNQTFITVQPQTVYSDANGYFSYANILWGNYILTVSGQAYNTVFKVRVSPTTTNTVPLASLGRTVNPPWPNPQTNYYTMPQIDALLSGISGGGGGGGGTNGLTSQQITNAAQTVLSNAVGSAAYHPAADFYSSGNPSGFQTAGQVLAAIASAALPATNLIGTIPDVNLSTNVALLNALPLNSLTRAGVVPAGTGHANQFYLTDGSGNPGWSPYSPGAPTFGSIGSGINNSMVGIVDSGANIYPTNSGKITSTFAQSANASSIVGGGVGGTIPFNALPSNLVTNTQSGVMFSSSLNTFAITNPALGIAMPLGVGNSAYGTVLRFGGSSLLGIQAGAVAGTNFYGEGSGLTLNGQSMAGTMLSNGPAIYVDSTNGNDAWSGTDILHPVQTLGKASTIAGTNWSWFLFPGRTYDLNTNGPWLVQEGSKIYAWGATVTTTNNVANVTGQTILYASGSFTMHGGALNGGASAGNFQFPIYLNPTNSALPPMQVVLDGVSITNYSDGIYSLLGGGTANRTVKLYARNCSIFTGFDCININQAAQPSTCEFWLQGCRIGALAVTNQSTIVRGVVAGPGSWYIDGCDIKAMGGTGSGADIGILLQNKAQVLLAGTTITIDTTNKPSTCYKVQSDVHGEKATINGHPMADSEVTGNVVWSGDVTNSFLANGFISSDASGNRFWSLNANAFTNLNFSALLSGTNTWAGDNIYNGNQTNNGTAQFNGLLSASYFTTTVFTNNLGQYGLWGPSAYDASSLTNMKAGNTVSVVSGGSVAASLNPNGSTNFALTITGGGGSGLPGTNQIIAYGDARETNAVGMFGNTWLLSNALNQVSMNLGTTQSISAGSYLSVGYSNYNAFESLGGTNDWMLTAGNTNALAATNTLNGILVHSLWPLDVAGLLSGNTLTVTNGANIGGAVWTTNSVNVGNGLRVAGTTVLSNAVNAFSTVGIGGTLFTTSSVNAGNGLQVAGTTILSNAVNAYSTMGVGGALFTTSSVNAGSGLQVAGTAVLSNAVNAYSTMGIGGALFTTSSINAGNGLSVAGTLIASNAVNAYSTVNIGGATWTTNSVNVGNGLQVAGPAVFTNALAVSTNALPEGASTVIVDFSKPSALILTNASFQIGGAANIVGGSLNHSTIIVSNSSGSLIATTVAAGWKILRPGNVNVTLNTTNGGVSQIDAWVYPNVSSNILFSPAF